MTHFIQPTYIISILIAISVHEWAHAFSANKLGDPTAEREGRLTLNPVAHIDVFGALMFIIVGFGWAKPIPVNPLYFRKPHRDMAITALAGPFSNLVLAFFAFIGLNLLLPGDHFSAMQLLDDTTASSPALTIGIDILRSSLFVNLALMAFNLFPIAPLDGSNIVRIMIPRKHAERYEDFVQLGPWILIFLLVFESILPIPVLSGWVMGIANAVLNGFSSIAALP